MKRYFLIITFFLVVFAVGSASAETTIIVSTFGGTYEKAVEEAFGQPFTKATGIKVIYTSVPTLAKMEAQVKTENIEWDVVDVESRMLSRGVRSGIFEPLDLSMINARDFVEGSVTKYGIGFNYFSYNVCYRTDNWPVGKGPKSMKDLWDVNKFPGARVMNSKPVSNLEAALLADGVPRNKIYPIDVDRALKKMRELRPHIRVFWRNSGQAQQIMREKEADLGFVSSGRMIQLAEQGIPVTWEWNDMVVVLDSWTILKGCKNKDAAMKFIAFASDPKRLAIYAERMNYGPANKKAYDFIKKEKAVLMPTYPENFAKGVVLDAEWYAENEADAERRWEAWKME